jgi:hypothetical protein
MIVNCPPVENLTRNLNFYIRAASDYTSSCQ